MHVQHDGLRDGAAMKRKRNRGQALVEFAFVFPIIVNRFYPNGFSSHHNGDRDSLKFGGILAERRARRVLNGGGGCLNSQLLIFNLIN